MRNTYPVSPKPWKNISWKKFNTLTFDHHNIFIKLKAKCRYFKDTIKIFDVFFKAKLLVYEHKKTNLSGNFKAIRKKNCWKTLCYNVIDYKTKIKKLYHLYSD